MSALSDSIVTRPHAKKVLYVNGKFLCQPVTGVQRYAMGVMTAWDEALSLRTIDPAKYAITILAPGTIRQCAPFRNIKIEFAQLFTGKLWEQLYLPFHTRGALLFSPSAVAPMLKKRHVVTIHDAGVSATPWQYSLTFRLYYQLVYTILGLTTQRIFTVSDFSRTQLRQHFNIPPSKVIVARPGFEQILRHKSDSSILTKHNLVPGKFLLGVSSRSTIKNFDTLIRAWESLNDSSIRLVIAGGHNRKLFGRPSSSSSHDSIFLGYVTDGELRSLYENAACLIYPSLYEGFGLPPVEAMACKCPVLVSNRSALPETCADAALYCDPFDVDEMRNKIRSLLDDPLLAERMRSKGLERIKELSYTRCAAVLWDTIKGLL